MLLLVAENNEHWQFVSNRNVLRLEHFTMCVNLYLCMCACMYVYRFICFLSIYICTHICIWHVFLTKVILPKDRSSLYSSIDSLISSVNVDTFYSCQILNIFFLFASLKEILEYLSMMLAMTLIILALTHWVLNTFQILC